MSDGRDVRGCEGREWDAKWTGWKRCEDKESLNLLVLVQSVTLVAAALQVLAGRRREEAKQETTGNQTATIIVTSSYLKQLL